MRINGAPSWFYLQDYTGMYGQNNIKLSHLHGTSDNGILLKTTHSKNFRINKFVTDNSDNNVYFLGYI